MHIVNSNPLEIGILANDLRFNQILGGFFSLIWVEWPVSWPVLAAWHGHVDPIFAPEGWVLPPNKKSCVPKFRDHTKTFLKPSPKEKDLENGSNNVILFYRC